MPPMSNGQVVGELSLLLQIGSQELVVSHPDAGLQKVGATERKTRVAPTGDVWQAEVLRVIVHAEVPGSDGTVVGIGEIAAELIHDVRTDGVGVANVYLARITGIGRIAAERIVLGDVQVALAEIRNVGIARGEPVSRTEIVVDFEIPSVVASADAALAKIVVPVGVVGRVRHRHILQQLLGEWIQVLFRDY